MTMDRWFRLPEVGDGTVDNAYRPDTKGYDIDGFSGNTAHPNGSPIWVVRVYADEATLDALAAESGVVELSSVPTDALNNMFGQNRTAAEWEEGLKIE